MVAPIQSLKIAFYGSIYAMLVGRLARRITSLSTDRKDFMYHSKPKIDIR
jgi:hypothetical protein